MNNNSTTMKQREISLIDLLAEILLHWRTILLAMLCGGVFLGGISYARSFQSASELSREAEEQQSIQSAQQTLTQEELKAQWEQQKVSLEASLSEEQIGNVTSALNYKRLYEERADYQENSLLMRMDAFHIQQAELTFIIHAEEEGQLSNIKRAYENLIAETALYTYVREQCGIESGVDELIMLSVPGYRVTGNTTGENMAFGQGVVLGDESNIFSIRVLHEDSEVCQAMAEAVTDYVQREQKELQDTLGNHSVELLSFTQGEVADNDIADLQKSNADAMYSLQNNYIKLKDAFTDEETKYFEHMLAKSSTETSDNEEQESGEEETEAGTETGISIKYIILGMVLFVFIYIFLLFLSYILNDKLRCTDNLQEIYNIPQLGTIFSVPRKRLFGAVDGWIQKLRYHNRRKFTSEESVGLAGVAVKMAAKKQGIGQVCLIGCKLADKGQAVCEDIKASLSSENIEAVILDNVLYDAEAMEKLENMKGAVLVETAGSTLYEEVEKELQLLERQKITVLGGVVVE